MVSVVKSLFSPFFSLFFYFLLCLFSCFHFIFRLSLRSLITKSLAVVSDIRSLCFRSSPFSAQATAAAELQPVFQLEYEQADQAGEMLVHEHQTLERSRLLFLLVCHHLSVSESLFLAACRDAGCYTLTGL